MIPGENRPLFEGPYGYLFPLLFPPIAGLCAAPFVFSGFELAPGELRVELLLWTTRVDLTGLARAVPDPSAMRLGIQTFGADGLYSISGFYWGSALGTYRAFVTDPKRECHTGRLFRTQVVTGEGRHFPGESLTP